jgi:hypothetical protein
MGMTSSRVLMVGNNGVTVIVISKLDEIVMTVVTPHWSRRWPVTVMFKLTLSVGLFKPSTVTQATLSSVASSGTM